MTDAVHRQLAVAGRGKNVERYNPYFMNDAFEAQDVLGSYRFGRLFRGLQRRLDPEGLFGERVGGFKF